MDDDIANLNVLDSHRHLEHILTTIEVEHINVDNGALIVGNPNTGVVLNSQTVHAHTNVIITARTEIKIETLHIIILFFLENFINRSFQTAIHIEVCCVQIV